MLKRNKWLVAIPVAIIAGFLIWYFSKIVVYIIVAAVLSIIGKPLVRLLSRVKIGRFHIPRVLCALLTLILIFGVFFGFFALVLPMLVNQASSLTALGSSDFMENLKEPIAWAENMLMKYRIMAPGEDLDAMVAEKLAGMAGNANIPDILNSIVGWIGNIFIAVFSIGFITFFFLKQDRMLLSAIMLFTPVTYQTEVKHVYLKIIKLLSRYFLGLCLDLLIVMTLITIGTLIFGFKNALMIGIFAGMMNIIPYVGPFIGWGIAMILALSGKLDAGGSFDLTTVALQVSGVLVVINLLDAFIFQPTIYSNVVKAHPLEIFLVILIAGSAAGIPGMVLAIPGYTVLRIVAKEFLSSSRFVKRLTRNI